MNYNWSLVSSHNTEEHSPFAALRAVRLCYRGTYVLIAKSYGMELLSKYS